MTFLPRRGNASDLVSDIQRLLRDLQLPAWLFYDFRGLDPIALRILEFDPSAHTTRRWFYLVPAQGTPIKLVHRIESGVLDHLPGTKEIYLRWEELRSKLESMLNNLSSVAMQYSEKNAIPYISRVDAGTRELVQSCGPQVVSSADAIQRFESVWSADQVKEHRTVAQTLTSIVNAAFEKASADIQSHGSSSEWSIQDFILRCFEEESLRTDSPPIVAVNQNSGDPHYQPSKERHSEIRKGDFLLIDLWARTPGPQAVFADITWTAFFGHHLPSLQHEVFEIVRRSRDRGVEFLKDRLSAGHPPQGWEVDEAVREVIRQAGYGECFVHRTGHNLGREVHGNGVNFDNLETHDTRRIIPGIACTIEPGIYLKEFGVRSEINVYLMENDIEVTTPPQDEVVMLEC